MSLITNISAEADGFEWVVRLAGHEIARSPTRSGAINVAVRARASIAGLRSVVAERVEAISQTMARLAAERRVDEVLALAGNLQALNVAYRAALTRAQRELEGLRVVQGGLSYADCIREERNARLPVGMIPPTRPWHPEPPEAA